MDQNHVSDEDALWCILAAIQRCRASEETWKLQEANPHSTGEERELAKQRFKQTEDEFGWQWRNVAQLLEKKTGS